MPTGNEREQITERGRSPHRINRHKPGKLISLMPNVSFQSGTYSYSISHTSIGPEGPHTHKV